MKKMIIALITLLLSVTMVQAQVREVPAVDTMTSEEVTPGASVDASAGAFVVNPNARQIILEKKDQDLTDVTGGKTDELAAYLLAKPQPKMTWYNFLQVWMRGAVNMGLPSTLIVLLILFPLVAALIAFSRHVLGLTGFGIYTPAVLSVALVSTGIELGIATFIVIVVVTVLLQKLLKRINLAHLPKSSLILWGVCSSMIFFLIGMTYWGVDAFFSLTIFPLLILISLSENFTSTQLFSTTKEAAKLTLETLFLATISALIIGSEPLQKFVILNPEVSLLTILIFNWLIGRYNGLRLMELVRFKALVKKN